MKSHIYVDAFNQTFFPEMKLPTAKEFFLETRTTYLEKMWLLITKKRGALSEMVDDKKEALWANAPSKILDNIRGNLFGKFRNPQI